MQDNQNIDYSQLLTLSEAAALKKLRPNLLAHHLAKGDAPRPVLIGVGGHRYYQKEEIEAWEPKRMPSRSHKRLSTKGRNPK